MALNMVNWAASQLSRIFESATYFDSVHNFSKLKEIVLWHSIFSSEITFENIWGRCALQLRHNISKDTSKHWIEHHAAIENFYLALQLQIFRSELIFDKFHDYRVYTANMERVYTANMKFLKSQLAAKCAVKHHCKIFFQIFYRFLLVLSRQMYIFSKVSSLLKVVCKITIELPFENF